MRVWLETRTVRHCREGGMRSGEKRLGTATFLDYTDRPCETITANGPMRVWLEENTGFLEPGLDRRHFLGRAHVFADVTASPASTRTAGGAGCHVTTTDEPAPPPVDKPPYRVPSMADVEALRGTNGYRVASTFSGCGGTCLGFEMAGFDVAWANEFDPLAADTYAANHPATVLDRRGIRAVRADDILDALDLAPGELDVFEGSPPCSKFSTAGKRAKSWGKVTGSDSAIGQQNVEDLFFEYVRLLDALQPRVFVAENVAGLNKGVAKGYLIDIIKGLKACGYRAKVGVLDAQWLGVPQRRKRLIFMGVRDDLDGEPTFPKPLPYRYSVAEACPWLIGEGEPPDVEAGAMAGVEAHHKAGRELARIAPGEHSDRYFSMSRAADDEPSPTVLAGMGGSGTKGVFVPHEMRRLSIAELRRICSFPDDFRLLGSYADQWARCGNAVPPLMARAVAVEVSGILDRMEGDG
jgi:DNA (cytosine-5)-methyltransferase 1